VGSSKITINDVAREAGVSIATVSRFLNNPSSIRIENRKKLEAVVSRMDYKPLVYARRLAGGKLGVFGLIVPGYEGLFSSFFASEIIRGVGVSLERFNLDLHLHIYNKRDRFNNSLVDGVIFADIIDNQDQLERLVSHQIPCIVINRKIEDINAGYIAIDNFKGAYQAVEYLIKHGHKLIAHIAGDEKVQGARERVEGYRSALASHNIAVNEDYLKSSDFSRLEARKAVEQLFSLSAPPTAIFAASDEMAIEVINFAHNQGIKVPEDISVIGFDDNPSCSYEHISLTTVRQPLFQMASQAVEALHSVLEKEEDFPRIVLDPELVIRDTVGLR